MNIHQLAHTAQGSNTPASRPCFQGGPSSALQSCAGFGLISYILDFGGHGGDAPPANAAVACSSSCRTAATSTCTIADLSRSSGCCLASPGFQGQQSSGCNRICKGGSQCLGAASASASIVLAQRAGRQVGKLHRQWWQRQSQLQLPPVMWLGYVLRPDYFKA